MKFRYKVKRIDFQKIPFNLVKLLEEVVIRKELNENDFFITNLVSDFENEKISKFFGKKRYAILNQNLLVFPKLFKGRCFNLNVNWTCDCIQKGIHLWRMTQFKNFVFLGYNKVSEQMNAYYKKVGILGEYEKVYPFDKEKHGTNFAEAVIMLEISKNEKEFVLLDSVSFNIPSAANFDGEFFEEIMKPMIDKWQPDFIKSHGTGTQQNDESEARVYSKYDIPVIALKWKFNHLGKCTFIEDLYLYERFMNREKVEGYKNENVILDNLVKEDFSFDKDTVRILSFSAGFGGSYTILVYELNR